MAEVPAVEPSVQVAPPKRRGRKRKQDSTPLDTLELQHSVAASPVITELSRSGRKRRQINYFELANPEGLESFADVEEVYEEKPARVSNTGVKKLGRPKKIQNVNNPTSKKTPMEENGTGDNFETVSISSIPEESTNGFAATPEREINSAEPATYTNGNLIESECSNSSSQDFKNKSHKNKLQKYSYTGQTVKMMNTLFNLFSGKKESPEDGEAAGKCKIKMGRPRKNQEPGEKNLGNTVSCAVCKVEMDKTLWIHHKQRYHNNLAWRVGEPALDLTDQTFVMHTLNLLYKKKKPLYCATCGYAKKSVIGFLSHQSQCNKSTEELQDAKIACELCDKKMLPVSLSSHMKLVHCESKTKEPKDYVATEEEEEEEEDTILPSKRKSAALALKVIEKVTKTETVKNTYFTTNLNSIDQEFALEILRKELETKHSIACKFDQCVYKSNEVEESIKHFSECHLKPLEGLMCNLCLGIQAKLEDMLAHLGFIHDIDTDAELNSLHCNSETKASAIKLPEFALAQCKKGDRVLYPNAFEWAYKFREENYNCRQILAELSSSNWPALPSKLAVTYLPTLTQSCSIARTYRRKFSSSSSRGNSEFKKYKLFESELHDDGKSTFFCGGPVTTFAWLPTPHRDITEKQVLAVSVLRSPDERYYLNENYSSHSLIQFWSCGVLRSKAKPNLEPRLAMSLAFDDGPIWDMEWCPSGCYSTDKSGRMGLLAVAGSDPVVYIYSVPFFSEDRMKLFYKPKPVVKLLLQRPDSKRLVGDLKYYPTKISWSKASGHAYIAVGYSNGFVGIFDLETESVILKQKDFQGIMCVFAYKFFQPHTHTITALELHYLNGGCRWIMTASADREVNLFDLKNHNYPISSLKRNIVTDACWLPHWPCFFIGNDEGSTKGNASTNLRVIRNSIMYPHLCTILSSSSTVSSISGSDWLNGIIQVNTVGEITATFPHQLIHVDESYKILRHKRIYLGNARLVEKRKLLKRLDEIDKQEDVLNNVKNLNNCVKDTVKEGLTSCDESLFYHDAEEKYGVLFCDNKMESYADFPDDTTTQLFANSKCMQKTLPNRYSMAKITKVALNPNRQASLFYATSYQTGFLRISWLQFLKDDPQIK